MVRVRVVHRVMPFSHRGLLSAGLIMGIALLLTSLLSVGAIVQRNHVLGGLVILNWTLIADAIIVLVVGTILWFYTLRERAEFHTLYSKLQPSQRVTIQDMVAPLFLRLSDPSDDMISSAAVDISIRQTSWSSEEISARTKPLPIRSTRLSRATSAFHPSHTLLTFP
jgi:hypothetical protein